MTKEQILKALCKDMDLEERDIKPSMNLLSGPIDSLDFLRYAQSVQKFAAEQNIPFDIQDFLYSNCVSVDEIYIYLRKAADEN